MDGKRRLIAAATRRLPSPPRIPGAIDAESGKVLVGSDAVVRPHGHPGAPPVLR